MVLDYPPDCIEIKRRFLYYGELLSHTVLSLGIKNTLIKRLVSWLKPTTSNRGDPKRFLVLFTKGVGDTLWATPALRALRECFPSSYVGVLTSPLGAQLLKHNRRIDELFSVRNPSLMELTGLYLKLKPKRITHVLCFHPSQRLILPFASLLGAEHIIGSYGINKGLDSLLTQAVDNLNMHEIQRRLHLVAHVGAHTLDPSMELPLGPEDEREAAQVLASLRIPSYIPLIGLHPGSKDLFKRWPPSHFIELGKRLVAERGCQILVTGSQEERALTETVASSIPSALPVTHLSLLGMGALLKRLSLFVTNDTGPMHLAFAGQVPTLGLFVPTNPALCGPCACPSATLISRKPTCTPCLKNRCQEPFCLLQIGVEEAYQAAIKILHSKGGSR
jgi:ADP-heptose:LPS heptosyltransferase